jgi:TRAP transporter TAXI family solute receptor
MMAYRTDGQYDRLLKGMKKAPFRLLMGGPPTFVSVVVREDAGINTGKDLKGKKFVGIFMGCEACTLQGEAFLANWGLTKDDVVMIRTPGLGEAIDFLIEGKAHASGTGAPGMAVLRELDAKRGARFLSLNPAPEAVKAYQALFPASIKEITPAPDLAGVKEPIYMAAFEDLIIANKDLVSDDTAYKLVEALWEHNEELRKTHVNLKYVTHDAMVSRGAPMPYHPGAIKFYKEKGVWPEALEAKNKEFLEKEK